MSDSAAAVRLQVQRQVAHWRAAVVTLDDPENFASETAWRTLERYLDLALRRELQAAVDRLTCEVDALAARLAVAATLADLDRVRRDVVAFRRRFAQVETVLEFYGDAVNRRTGRKQSAVLRACDQLATASMAIILPALGQQVPPVLTYVDKGMGASILRHGLRLWDPNSVSPAAAIKITRHNLYRPTSLLHEAGHQVAFQLGWNAELAATLERELSRAAPGAASAWSGWTSEVSADTFAFACTGYGAVAALHDVVAGEEGSVFRYPLGDPHPIAYLRVLLGVEMCRTSFGAGAWDDLAAAWRLAHPVDRAPAVERDLIMGSVPLLPRIAAVCLTAPMRAFGNRPLTTVVDPGRVAPAALAQLVRQVGPALFTSPHWLRTESLRLLAISSYRIATEPDRATEIARQAESWLTTLGAQTPAAAA